MGVCEKGRRSQSRGRLLIAGPSSLTDYIGQWANLSKGEREGVTLEEQLFNKILPRAKYLPRSLQVALLFLFLTRVTCLGHRGLP